MPWKENRTLDQRARLIQEYQEGESITELAEMFNVSRRTIYKWLRASPEWPTSPAGRTTARTYRHQFHRTQSAALRRKLGLPEA